MRRSSLLLICLPLVCGGCHRGPYEPVEITPDEDRCAACRMAVSQKPFAGQIMTAHGTPCSSMISVAW